MLVPSRPRGCLRRPWHELRSQGGNPGWPRDWGGNPCHAQICRGKARETFPNDSTRAGDRLSRRRRKRSNW
eukprot:8223559-Alexandrium_andersonii.AAC.1